MKKQENGKLFHVAVAIRENGQLDFYSDFRLVDQSLAEEKFVDIECDFKNFYIKRKVGDGLGELSAATLFKCAH